MRKCRDSIIMRRNISTVHSIRSRRQPGTSDAHPGTPVILHSQPCAFTLVFAADCV